jgi:AraC-like DNA-binding protein
LNETPCILFDDSLSLISLFDNALEEAWSKKLGYFNKIRDVASLLLINSARIMSGMRVSDYPVPLKSSIDDYRFKQIDKFIYDNIKTMVTVKQVADYLHLSEKQVTRIVQNNIGISTKELIKRKKTLEAADLIKNTKLPVKEVSDTLGFSSEYYFSQYFKKFFGKSPTSLRKFTRHMSENIK